MDLATQIFDQLNDANKAAREHIAIGREQGRRDSEALRKAAAHAVAMMDRYPEAELPSPLLAALVSLKAAL